ncbi:MAG: TolC family outer membrane protein [Azospirillaceae bacterium]|nr:TolC family outer membrane protein [Azospirillaceae bacterium]
MVWAAVGLAAIVGQGAAAQTLEQALSEAYNTNPTLQEQRAQANVVDEQVTQARAGYRPSATATGSVGGAYAASHGPTGSGATENYRTDLAQGSSGVTVSQPLYRGGATNAAVRGAEDQVQAQRATLLSTEEQVLLQGATAYLDVVRDQAILDLDRSDEQVLRHQLEQTTAQFQVGQLTRTDVSQAQSRLAGAIATRTQAEGTLANSRATFRQVIGRQPGKLAAPQTDLHLPGSLDEALSRADADNPVIITAQFNEAAARDQIDQFLGQLMPQATANSSVSRTWNASYTSQRQDTAVVALQVTVPIFDGGATSSRVRQARSTDDQKRIQIEDFRRQVAQTTTAAWSALTTARANIDSYRSQVRATDIALAGVRQEAAVGTRTVLDILNAEQESLAAQVALVGAQHDELVAEFQVLYAAGALTARQLSLPVTLYDVESHYQAVRNQWRGTTVGN